MAGQMGNARVTVLNLEVVEADAERDLVLGGQGDSLHADR
jgi:ribosomal protein L3